MIVQTDERCSRQPGLNRPLKVRLNWRRDLNCPACGGERSCLNSAGTADPRGALFEHYLEAATPIPVIRKPFDVLAEGLLCKESGGGGNRTRVHGRDRKGFSKLSLRSYLAAEHHAGRCSTGQSGVGVPCSRHGPPGYQASLLLKDTLRGGPEGPPVT